MRALVLVAVFASACTTAQAKRVHRGGEIATAVGLTGILACVTVAAFVPATEDTLTTVGVGFVPLAVIGALLYISTDAKANETPEPMQTRRQRHQAAAWELTKQAADAARAQDCTQVQAIAPRVRELDHDFHVMVFMRDVAIQRCLRER